MSISFGSYAEEIEEADFLVNFNIAKQHLSQRRIKEALPYLLYLQKQYPKNANLKYLVGVCYAEAEIVNPKTLELLEAATSKASLEYDPNSLSEERTPIYVFYYLSIAYSQHHLCNKAERARAKFLEVYPHEDQFYVEESKRWLQICKKSKSIPKQDSLPTFPNFKPYNSEVVKAQEDSTLNKTDRSLQDAKLEPKELPNDTKAPKPKEIVTKRIEYSTDYPLYGVQLGAFKEVVPVSRFKELKNVDAFMDKKGLIRYVIGHFSIHSQAMSLLEAVKAKGYQDAFVVNVNDTRKFADEVVSINAVNIRAKLSGKVKYCLQLGAFQENIPEQTAKLYFQIEGIEEYQIEDFTFLTVGDFDSYQEAKSYESKIKKKGFEDAFIIALHKGKKIPLQQALDYNP